MTYIDNDAAIINGHNLTWTKLNLDQLAELLVQYIKSQRDDATVELGHQPLEVAMHITANVIRGKLTNTVAATNIETNFPVQSSCCPGKIWLPY